MQSLSNNTQTLEEENVSNIDIRYIAFILLRRWWIIVSFVLIASIIAAVVSMYYITPQYVGTATLFIYKQNSNDSGMVTSLNSGSQLVKDATILVKSQSMLEKAIAKAEVSGVNASTLATKITATSKPDTRVFVIKVVDDNPMRAALLANAISEVFVEELKVLIGGQTAASGAELVSIVDRAQQNKIPVSPNVNRNVAIAAFLGALLAIVIILIIEMLDDTIRSPEVLRIHYGVDLIGFIPVIEE